MFPGLVYVSVRSDDVKIFQSFFNFSLFWRNDKDIFELNDRDVYPICRSDDIKTKIICGYEIVKNPLHKNMLIFVKLIFDIWRKFPFSQLKQKNIQIVTFFHLLKRQINNKLMGRLHWQTHATTTVAVLTLVPWTLWNKEKEKVNLPTHPKKSFIGCTPEVHTIKFF